MPLGSQEDPRSIPQAVQQLEAQGREATVSLREVALEMRAMMEDDDRAGVGDVLAALATRLLGHTTAGGGPPTEQ